MAKPTDDKPNDTTQPAPDADADAEKPQQEHDTNAPAQDEAVEKNAEEQRKLRDEAARAEGSEEGFTDAMRDAAQRST